MPSPRLSWTNTASVSNGVNVVHAWQHDTWAVRAEYDDGTVKLRVFPRNTKKSDLKRGEVVRKLNEQAEEFVAEDPSVVSSLRCAKCREPFDARA